MAVDANQTSSTTHFSVFPELFYLLTGRHGRTRSVAQCDSCLRCHLDERTWLMLYENIKLFDVLNKNMGDEIYCLFWLINMYDNNIHGLNYCYKNHLYFQDTCPLDT